MLFKNGKKKSYVVYTAGAPVLKAVARPVVSVTAGIRQLAGEMLEALRKEGGGETTIRDASVVTDYSNRREIFAFTEDGILYKVVAELFLYQGSVYLTTGFEGDKNTAKEQKLTGVKLPEE